MPTVNMVLARTSEAAASNEAMAKTTPTSRKCKAGDSNPRPGRSSKQQATAPSRMTRSRFRKLNGNSLTPETLNPGLEAKPRRRRAPEEGQRSTGAAAQPHDAVVTEESGATGRLNSQSAHDPQPRKRVSDADVAAASRLVQAALRESPAIGVSVVNAHVPRTSAGGEYHNEQGLKQSVARAVGDAEAIQAGTPPTQPDASPPLLSTCISYMYRFDDEPNNNNRGISGGICPVAMVGRSDQARVAAVDAELGAAREWSDVQVASQEKPKEQVLPPRLPDKADTSRPQREKSKPEQIHSPAKAYADGEDKAIAMPTPTPPLIRSGGIGGEVESPVQRRNPGGLDLTLHWQSQANRAGYAADVAQILIPREQQVLIGPLPPAVMQWEPDNHSIGGREYSPEVF